MTRQLKIGTQTEMIELNNDIMLYGFPPRYGFDLLNYKKPKFYLSIGEKEEKQDMTKKGNNNEQSRES